MKGVVFLGDRKLDLQEFPDPTPGPRDVVLEIKASGMCGSDLHVYREASNRAIRPRASGGGLIPSSPATSPAVWSCRWAPVWRHRRPESGSG